MSFECTNKGEVIDQYPNDLFERSDDELISIIRKNLHISSEEKKAYEALFFTKKGREILKKYILALKTCQLENYLFPILIQENASYIVGEDPKDRARFYFLYERDFSGEKWLFDVLEDEIAKLPHGAINKIVNDALISDKITFLGKRNKGIDKQFTTKCLKNNCLNDAKKYLMMRQINKIKMSQEFKDKKAKARQVLAKIELLNIFSSYPDIINQEFVQSAWREHAIEVVMS